MELTDKIRFYNKDCMEAMAEMPDNAFDLAIVDVNYGIKQDGRNNHTRAKLAKSKNYAVYSRYDNESPPEEYFKDLMRVSVNQIVWGANHFISKVSKDSSCWVVWDKDNGKTDFADCELAWTSFETAVRKFKYRWQGMLQENMSHKEIIMHPNQKPVALYKWLLSNYAKPGDKILDTHGGSLSIAIACHDLGFDLTAYELDADYYKAACERVKKHVSQGQLFTPEQISQPKQLTIE